MKKIFFAFFIVSLSFTSFGQLPSSEAEAIIMENVRTNQFRYSGLSHQYIIKFSEPEKLITAAQLEELATKYLPEAYELNLQYDGVNELVFKVSCEVDYALIKQFISIVAPSYLNINKIGYFKN